MTDLHAESAKWRHDDDAADDAPAQQSMRESVKPIQRRSPTSDQKKVRREMARSTRTAGYEDENGRRRDICTGCLRPIHDTSDPNVPWVHDHSHNSACDVDVPEDAVMFAGTDHRQEAQPISFEGKKVACVACQHQGLAVVASCGGPACGQCGCLVVEAAWGGDGTCPSCGLGVHPRENQSWKDAKDEHEQQCSAKTSVRHQATNFQTNIATSDGRTLINPGDSIRTPTGQTMKVNQIRRHETSRDHYYLDTDAGTTVVPWSTSFEVVPSNQQQQAFPGLGTPGGNSNHLPFDPANSGASNDAPGACPVCGAKGSLQRQGDKFKCSRCGYAENYAGGSGMGFSDSPQTIRAGATLDTRSAIARRATQVLDQNKETGL